MSGNDFIKAISLVFFILIVLSPSLHAADGGPLSTKGEYRYGVNVGYGFSVASNEDVRFASLYPFVGRVMTDPIGEGWTRGSVEVIIEGAFSYVHKGQSSYSAGVNCLARYNFLPDSKTLRPFVQGGPGIVQTNLELEKFGSKFNFSHNAGLGLQYFFSPGDAVTLEWRYFHLSNGGLDDDNDGLNMNNFFIGFSRMF